MTDGVVLVAGGTGRLGSLVVKLLLEHGQRVRVLTRDTARAEQFRSRLVDVVVGDLRKPSTLHPAFTEVSVVVSAVHGFAGPGGVSPTTVDRDGNVNLIDQARQTGAEVVLMSVLGASADSAMELFRMKYAAEEYLKASGVPFTIVRSAAFLELWIGMLQQTAKRSGRPIVFGRGENPINFVSVIDVAALVALAVTDRTRRGSTLEIGGPENLKFNELAAAVQRATGRTGQPRHVPRPVLRAMACTIGRFRPELGRQTRAALAMDSTDLTFDRRAIADAYPDVPNTSAAMLLG